jgi:hypothetical protein
MPSSGMLRHVALVRTDVSEELSVSIIRVTRIGELRTVLAVLATDARYKEIQSDQNVGSYILKCPKITLNFNSVWKLLSRH